MKIMKKIVTILSALFLMSMLSVEAEGFPDFTTLVEKHSTAVVNISTIQNIQSKSAPDFLGGDDDKDELLDEFMRRFFDRDGGENGDLFTDEKETSSLGSGFIISKDGYIVTNYHVIRDADKIIVNLSDRRELSAILVGSDKRSDIALLKVEANDLPVLEIGSSEKLKVGEWVVAIGSPFGFDHSVTAGIVSAKGRSLPSENYVPFIQTDVAINPGNSGGPLFNLKGEVVGINSQIYSRTGGFMGVSFAIPIDVATRVVEQLKTKGKVSRGWLGVYIQEVTRELALSFGLEHATGALVVEVMKDGPAIGILQQGDVVLEFDNKRVKNGSALPVIVGSTPIDKPVDVKISRAGKIQVLSLKLGVLPDEDVVPPKPVKKKMPPKKIDKVLGMELSDLDERAKKALEIEGGVLVKRVNNDPAKKAGIERGDVLLMFKGEDIKSLAHFTTLTENLVVDKIYAVLVLRSGSARFLAIKAVANKKDDKKLLLEPVPNVQ